jgi:hypothetical protein
MTVVQIFSYLIELLLVTANPALKAGRAGWVRMLIFAGGEPVLCCRVDDPATLFENTIVSIPPIKNGFESSFSGDPPAGGRLYASPG